ncbi:MAG TPA: ATP-binding protein [Candidatus Limnocylindria bacterium]|nr:ATP-binding protein [Candidatus Limnocylindria bacterium]
MRSLRRSAPRPHFPVGGPVPGEDLVGRDGYLRAAAARLDDGAHIVISGPRRIGKTSIILEALRRLRKRGALVAYVDCLAATDLRSLGEALADAALANVTGLDRTVSAARELAAGARIGRARFDDLAPALELARERSATRAFELALDVPRAVAARSGKRVVVALDEFQAAGRLGPRAFDVMRARFQAQRGVSYAFLGSEEGVLAALFGSRGSAFYRFAQPLELTDPAGPRFGIAPDEWLRYLVRKFAAKRVRLTERDADRILDATGGHPQDTMQLCARLYELAHETARRDVDADLILVAYERAMRELERPFALQWEELGRHKYLQQVAKRIAHGAVLYADDGIVPRAEVLRALDGLRARGLAVRLGRGRYEFVEPMFADHVRRTDERSAAAILVR